LALQARDLESDLLDLTECCLEDLRGIDPALLAPSLDRQLNRVYRIHGNFGDSGSPDRVD
jgi:hypothetical protein